MGKALDGPRRSARQRERGGEQTISAFRVWKSSARTDDFVRQQIVLIQNAGSSDRRRGAAATPPPHVDLAGVPRARTRVRKIGSRVRQGCHRVQRPSTRQSQRAQPSACAAGSHISRRAATTSRSWPIRHLQSRKRAGTRGVRMGSPARTLGGGGSPRHYAPRPRTCTSRRFVRGGSRAATPRGLREQHGDRSGGPTHARAMRACGTMTQRSGVADGARRARSRPLLRPCKRWQLLRARGVSSAIPCVFCGTAPSRARRRTQRGNLAFDAFEEPLEGEVVAWSR